MPRQAEFRIAAESTGKGGSSEEALVTCRPVNGLGEPSAFMVCFWDCDSCLSQLNLLVVSVPFGLSETLKFRTCTKACEGSSKVSCSFSEECPIHMARGSGQQKSSDPRSGFANTSCFLRKVCSNVGSFVHAACTPV